MSSFSSLLSQVASNLRGDAAWSPQRVEAGDPEAGKILEQILARGISYVHDTIELQLAELMEIRCPQRDLDDDEVNERIEDHLGGASPREYGTWVYYPWSKRVVHVLPEAEFRELRCCRNRNKITADEQQRLANLVVGVAGLSVGQATAVTLAMEEVGGTFRLADFDHLSLSNLNRLRAGVHDLGINKAVLAARQIFEINPYARVDVFTEGVQDHTLEPFLTGLDLLFEECDDLYIKIKLRERARALQIPVLMETSDRGLIDIERFDREPNRPLLHGLVGDVRAEDLRGLDVFDKVPIVLRMLGKTAISPRLAASMLEIRTSLNSWPQLASSVALGGAVNTDVARRVALGELQESGRYYVDLDRIVTDGSSEPLDVTVESDTILPEALAPLQAPPLALAGPAVTEDIVRSLVSYGAMAPSGGNCQPWRFEWGAGRLRCIHDRKRSASFLDFDDRASYLAMGSVVENISLAARQVGLLTMVDLFPDAGDPTQVCDLRFEPDGEGVRDRHLFDQLPVRVTNRKLGKREPLDAAAAAMLHEAAANQEGRLQLVEDAAQLEAIGRVLGEGDRVRLLHEVMHREMMHEIRWSAEEAQRTRDGLDLATLELSRSDQAGMRIIGSWKVMETVGRLGGGRSLEKPSIKAVAAASAVGLVTVHGHQPRDYVRGGRALQRVWLTANAQGYAFQPMTALLYLFLRMDAGGEGLTAAQQRELTSLRNRYAEIFDIVPEEGEMMLFRISRADRPTARSLRRSVDEILTIEPRS